MIQVDQVNGMFEALGAGFALLNMGSLYKSRKVVGVYWPTTAFFTLWGVWNLYYYPALHQWFSFYGGLMLVIFNGCWVLMAMYFVWRPRRVQR